MTLLGVIFILRKLPKDCKLRAMALKAGGDVSLTHEFSASRR